MGAWNSSREDQQDKETQEERDHATIASIYTSSVHFVELVGISLRKNLHAASEEVVTITAVNCCTGTSTTAFPPGHRHVEASKQRCANSFEYQNHERLKNLSE